MPSLAFASVAGEVNKANDLYKQGKFDDSLALYQKALELDDKSLVVKYDLGTALYKKGDYTKAMGFLEQAAQDKNIKVKPKAEYNLGNVLYKSGIQKENTNVDEAIKSLQEALGHYGQTIAVDPKDQDAIFNQDFVKKEIERLKQKKKQQQQNQRQQQNKKQQPSHTEDSYKSQQNQQSQQGQQNQQKQQKQQKEQPSQQSNSKDQKKKEQQSAQAQAQENQKELDRKQAEDLLEDYRENEEPKKLLNYMPKKIDDRPVLKDW
jgi:Ca-activated chloride channel homolog